jgi:hypothetical protein
LFIEARELFLIGSAAVREERAESIKPKETFLQSGVKEPEGLLVVAMV